MARADPVIGILQFFILLKDGHFIFDEFIAPDNYSKL